MIDKRKMISVAWKVILFVSAVMGILLQIGLFSDRLDLSVLNYYTLMSNMLCAVYFLPAAVYGWKHDGETLLPADRKSVV